MPAPANAVAAALVAAVLVAVPVADLVCAAVHGAWYAVAALFWVWAAVDIATTPWRVGP
jgi:hypothetical protein